VDDREPFLSRWSRRKLEAKEDAPAGTRPAPAPPGAAALPPASEPTAPGTDARTSAEFKEYFDPRVDETLRRTALKKMFNDPHFNVMDGLDTYVDDYSKPDPIPEAMLRQLNQAKDLLLFDDEKQAVETSGDTASAAAEAAASAPAAGTPALPETPAPVASDAAEFAAPCRGRTENS
jgi:hypothetical protein